MLEGVEVPRVSWPFRRTLGVSEAPTSTAFPSALLSGCGLRGCGVTAEPRLRFCVQRPRQALLLTPAPKLDSVSTAHAAV